MIGSSSIGDAISNETEFLVSFTTDHGRMSLQSGCKLGKMTRTCQEIFWIGLILSLDWFVRRTNILKYIFGTK